MPKLASASPPRTARNQLAAASVLYPRALSESNGPSGRPITLRNAGLSSSVLTVPSRKSLTNFSAAIWDGSVGLTSPGADVGVPAVASGFFESGPGRLAGLGFSSFVSDDLGGPSLAQPGS